MVLCVSSFVDSWLHIFFFIIWEHLLWTFWIFKKQLLYMKTQNIWFIPQNTYCRYLYITVCCKCLFILFVVLFPLCVFCKTSWLLHTPSSILCNQSLCVCFVKAIRHIVYCCVAFTSKCTYPVLKSVLYVNCWLLLFLFLF